jgi:site-specific recombinase XerD
MQEIAITDNLQAMPSEKVLDYFLSQQTEGTRRTYGSAIRAFFAFSGLDIREVTQLHALSYDAYLKSQYGPATVQRHISTLTRFFGFAEKLGVIDRNPFGIVKQRKVPNRVAEKFLTKKELDRLLDALAEKGSKRYILGLLLAATGARISEIQQLSWCDFLLLPDNSISINLLRKGNIRQLLPLRRDVFEVVKDFMGKELDPSDESPIFLNAQKKRASTVSLRTWIEEGRESAGLAKHITPHFLRHNFASSALAAGASLRNVQEYLNHSSVTTTQSYLHATDLRVGEFMPMTVKPLKTTVE